MLRDTSVATCPFTYEKQLLSSDVQIMHSTLKLDDMHGYQGNTDHALTVFDITIHIILRMRPMHFSNAACMMITDNNTSQKITV